MKVLSGRILKKNSRLSFENITGSALLGEPWLPLLLWGLTSAQFGGHVYRGLYWARESWTRVKFSLGRWPASANSGSDFSFYLCCWVSMKILIPDSSLASLFPIHWLLMSCQLSILTTLCHLIPVCAWQRFNTDVHWYGFSNDPRGSNSLSLF